MADEVSGNQLARLQPSNVEEVEDLPNQINPPAPAGDQVVVVTPARPKRKRRDLDGPGPGELLKKKAIMKWIQFWCAERGLPRNPVVLRRKCNWLKEELTQAAEELMRKYQKEGYFSSERVTLQEVETFAAAAGSSF